MKKLRWKKSNAMDVPAIISRISGEDCTLYELRDVRSALTEAMKNLTEREITAITLRSSGMTYKSCGIEMGIGGSRVQQIEYRGYWKLRRSAQLSNLRSRVEVYRYKYGR